MSVSVPLELTHLIARLHADFDALLPPSSDPVAVQAERNFLSRALAAFAIHKLAGCSLVDAAASVVDGGGDCGLDAIYFSKATPILWVVQSKFDSTGTGQVDLGAVNKFAHGVGLLLRRDFEAFRENAQIQGRKPELLKALETEGLQVRCVLVYSGNSLLAEDRKRVTDELRRTWCRDDDFLTVSSHNLTTIHDWLTGADQHQGVEKIDLTIFDPGWTSGPLAAIYGKAKLADLAALWDTHKQKLISANLRAYKGSTAVNGEIHETLRSNPEHFFYLNNGLTAYCERFVVQSQDRINPSQKQITAYGLSIVNGAQTLGTVGAHHQEVAGEMPDGFVMIKIISLHGLDEEQAFALKITQTTNYQNQITPQDFVALEEEQSAIASILAPSGVVYHYKTGADTPNPDDKNFTLDEATTALACLDPQKSCDLLAKIVGQKQALWSFEPVYPPPEEHRSRCARLFKTPRTALSIWRSVQTQRVVREVLKTAETGIRKDFFVNGRWLVLWIVFTRLKPQDGGALMLTAAEITEISASAAKIAEKLWDACGTKGFVSSQTSAGVTIWTTSKHFKSIFSSPADCILLKGAVMAALNAPPQPTSPSSSNT